MKNLITPLLFLLIIGSCEIARTGADLYENSVDYIEVSVSNFTSKKLNNGKIYFYTGGSISNIADTLFFEVEALDSVYLQYDLNVGHIEGAFTIEIDTFQRNFGYHGGHTDDRWNDYAIAVFEDTIIFN